MVTVADLGNADAAEEMHERTIEKRDQAIISRAEALATKKRLEAKAEVDREREIVMMPIADETVPMYPIEAGTVLEVTRTLIEGHRKGDELLLIEAADEQRRLMAEKSYYPDVFDREFFNQFEKEEIKDAWGEWTNRSRNTDEPLGNR